jgi:hypothetical protein
MKVLPASLALIFGGRKWRGVFTAVLVLGGVGFFNGCASVRSTTVHYLPATMETFPPKEPGTPIPLLSGPPKQDHKVIGTFAWETDHDWSFIRRSLEYNAQRAGADAMILRERETFRETTLVDIPPQMRWIPRVRYVRVTSGSGNNRTTRVVPVVRYWPIVRPGGVVSNTETWNNVSVDMIVFPKKAGDRN